MNEKKLAGIIRKRAAELSDGERPEDFDNAELLNVLARVLEGKAVARAFGAPGDWGYDTPIGEALAEVAPKPPAPTLEQQRKDVIDYINERRGLSLSYDADADTIREHCRALNLVVPGE